MRMKQSQVVVGGCYVAKVNGSLTTVRLDAMRTVWRGVGRSRVVFDVTNLRTGRKLTFRSAARFRGHAKLTDRGMERECIKAAAPKPEEPKL